MLEVSTAKGNIVDVVSNTIFAGEIRIENGKISSIDRSDEHFDTYILPGLVDAHVHIESSLLVPSQFARLAVVHGTVATVSDPHEIANVLGTEGVLFMIEDGKKVPFHFAFGAPSCVPATSFETAGAIIGPSEVEELLKRDDIYYLAEMMNFPGVLHGDPDVLSKIESAKAIGKPIDGHAPGLRGNDARHYIQAGMSTDHECFTLEEAKEKLQFGMKILIREGSAAKNFDTLSPLLKEYPDKIMFCSDDKHPDSLLEGHIDDFLRRAVAQQVDVMESIKIATKNPVEHYNLPCGLLQIGDSADFIEVNNLTEFRVERTVIQGLEVAKNGKSFIEPSPVEAKNNFNCKAITPENIKTEYDGKKVRVIDIIPGELVTKESTAILPEEDVMKLVVVNRYNEAQPSTAYVRGFGFTSGAIASSVAHDSHNIIVAGTDDLLITKAVNLLIESEGGLAFVTDNESYYLSLPVAGLMSGEDGYLVAEKYIELDSRAKQLGSTLPAPFMSLSFLALLVIPELKLSDKGLFDGKNFQFVPVSSEES